MRKVLLLPLVLALGCGEKPGSEDLDGDGTPASRDCDDQDATVYPGAPESCDGVDNDCDGTVDEMPATDPVIWYLDADGDGFGNAAETETACAAPEGFVENSDDCDDSSASIHPDATEVCDENDVDENCDGLSDDDDPAVDPGSQLAAYPDGDGDGYGTVDGMQALCELPQGHVENDQDCDDSTAAVNPDQVEVCDGLDNDCDASTSENGMARFVDDDNNVTDYSSFGGSAGAPDTDAPQSAGELTVCDGTYYIDWILNEDLIVRSQSGDPTAAVLDGGETNPVFRLGSNSSSGGGYTVNLSIDGVGFSNAFKSDFGGAITCSDAGVGEVMSWVDINNAIFSDNFSGWSGAAIASELCDLTVSNAEFSGNHSDGWGNVWTSGWTEITDSVFDGNTGAVTAGFVASYSVADVLLDGVDFFGNELTDDWGAGTVLIFVPSGGVTLDGVNVYDNLNTYETDYGTGISIWEASDVEIIGSTVSPGSVTGNAEPGPGLYITGSSVVSVDSVDFGVNGSAEDNLGADVSFGNYDYMAPDGASFLCSNGYCGENTDGDNDASNDSAECLIGEDKDTTFTYWTEDFLVGEAFVADSYSTLESFRYRMYSASVCTVDWYVLSTAIYSNSSVWRVEWASTNQSVANGNSWGSSGRIGYFFEPGEIYALVYAVDCPYKTHRYGWDSSASNKDPGFGTLQGLVYKTETIPDMSVGDTLSGITASTHTTGAYTSKIYVDDLEYSSASLCP